MELFSLLVHLFGAVVVFLLLKARLRTGLLLGASSTKSPVHFWNQLEAIIGTQNETVEAVRTLIGQRELECTQETASVLSKVQVPELIQYLISELKDEPPNLIKAYSLYKAISEISKSCRIGHTNSFYLISPASGEYQSIKVCLEALCLLEFNPMLLGNLPFDEHFFAKGNTMALNFPGMSRAFPDEIDRLQRHIVQLANAHVESGIDMRAFNRVIGVLMAIPNFTLANFDTYLQKSLGMMQVSEIHGIWFLSGIRQNRFDIAYHVFCKGMKMPDYATIERELFESFVKYVVMRRAFNRISSLLAASTEESSPFFGIPKDILRGQIFPFLFSLEYPQAYHDVAKCCCIKQS